LIVLGADLFLIDNDHLREFGQPRSVDSGNVAATKGIKYAVSSSGKKFEDLKCDEYTYAKGFKLLDNKIAARIKNQIILEKEQLLKIEKE